MPKLLPGALGQGPHDPCTTTWETDEPCPSNSSGTAHPATHKGWETDQQCPPHTDGIHHCTELKLPRREWHEGNGRTPHRCACGGKATNVQPPQWNRSQHWDDRDD